MIRRGEIYWINLDPTVGSETNKTRPGVVVSNDANNDNADTVTIVPLSTKVARVYSFHVLFPAGTYGNPMPTKAKAEQVRTVSKLRFRKRIGTLPPVFMTAVNQALRRHLAL